MKSKLFLLFVLTLGLTFGQKKELRNAQKLYGKGDVEGAHKILTDNAALFENADEKTAVATTFLKAQISQSKGDFQAAYELLVSIDKASALAAKVNEQLQSLSSEVVTSAISDNEAEDFENASSKLYLAYLINPETNMDYLYFAASTSVSNKDYDSALKYYTLLKEKEYTGIAVKYYVTEAATGNEIEVSETEYGIFKKSKDYSNFREEESPSRFPEIVKNIALIYAQQGDNEKAITAVQEARKSNPDDINLILTEANIYIQLDEKGKFQELMKEAIQQDPNNAVLYFNLGVVNNDLGDSAAARSYYEKAIELDPNYQASYLNLVSVILEDEKAIVDEMNGLGNSRADNARYEELTKKREGLFQECVPILKDLIKIDNDNEEAIKTLMNIYGTLGDNEGYKEMKALIGG